MTNEELLELETKALESNADFISEAAYEFYYDNTTQAIEDLAYWVQQVVVLTNELKKARGI
jgi:hypothetical protein